MPSPKILSCLFLFVSGAFAADIQLGGSKLQTSVTDHLIVSSSKNPSIAEDQEKSLFLHEASVRGNYRDYGANIRFSNRLAPQAPEADTRPFILEKKTLSYTGDTVDLKLGDSRQEFGRGIVLSLYQDDVFGLDNTLEGVSFIYHPSKWEWAVLGGRVNSVKSPVSINAIENPLSNRNVYLAGSSVEYRPSPGMRVGAHYLLALNEPNEKTRTMGAGTFDETYNQAGAYWAGSSDRSDTDFYLESNALLKQNLREGRYYFDPTGIGIYGMFSYSPAPWVVKVEGKHYSHYGFEFQRPPTLEEDLILTTNNHDSWAGRVTLEKRDLASHRVLKSSYLYGQETDFTLLGAETTEIHHWVVASEFGENIKWGLTGGFRIKPDDSNLTHGAFKVKIPTAKAQALDINFRKEYSNINLAANPAWVDKNFVDVSYSFSREWQMALGYEYLPFNADVLGQQFVNLTVQAKFGNFSAKALVGQTSGGTLCSGGVCRERPPYKGALFESVYLF